MEIGKLAEVDIRELWKHEQYDFSNWIAKDENIELLNDILGLTLVDVNKEAYVGAYRCDLTAIDETTGTTVIIENQLESSNHDHLGKIITYASGLDAKVIVWIVTNAREEHRSAIEWLNNNTNKEINFFLIELHAYKIGDSLPAPKFEILEQPNDFIKNSKRPSDSSGMNRSQAERLEFWTALNETIPQKGKPFNIRKATTDHWYEVAIGVSKAYISITLVNKDRFIGVELCIKENGEKTLYDSLYAQREKIQNELPFTLDWQRLDGKKTSRILTKIEGLNFDDHSNYSALIGQVIDRVVAMRETFKKYI